MFLSSDGAHVGHDTVGLEGATRRSGERATENARSDVPQGGHRIADKLLCGWKGGKLLGIESADGAGREPPNGPRLVRFGLLFYAGMALLALAWRVAWYGEPILYASPAARLDGLHVATDGAIGILAAAGLIGVSHLATQYTRWGEDLARVLAEALGRLSIGNAVVLALASGIAEELLFRGALQPRVGWLTASVLFGLVHFAPRRELLPWTAFAVAAGLLFGWLFDATGNLIAPITAHVLVNAVNIPLLVRNHGVGRE